MIWPMSYGKRTLACLSGGLTLLVILVAGRASQPSTVPTVMDIATASLLADWKERFDEEHLNYLTVAPYVIAGNCTTEQLASYRDQTILAATHALQASFFKKHPTKPILIILIADADFYGKLARRWFKNTFPPHYGFFRPDINVMLMNVSTGTGTLVHELTHALINPDFPNVPSWFNEGLASLYEQSQIDGDTIFGFPNWRLPALQKAIKDKQLRSFEELFKDHNFYGAELVGLNYAEARYLMLYLQEKKLLATYYARFRDHVADDPTGMVTLRDLVAPQKLADFENDWRAWVMTLRFMPL